MDPLERAAAEYGGHEAARLLARPYSKHALRAPRCRGWFLARVVFFPALGGLLFGYDIGATSYCVAQFERGTSRVDWGAAVAASTLLRGVVASAGLAGARGAAHGRRRRLRDDLAWSVRVSGRMWVSS